MIRTDTALAAAALALALASCQSFEPAPRRGVGEQLASMESAEAPETPGADRAQDDDGAKETKEAGESKGDAADPAADVAKKERAVRLAELDLEVARLKNDEEQRAARNAVDRDRAALTEAQRALDGYTEVEMGLLLERTGIDLARSRGRAEDAKAELEELEAMYAEEEFALSTKELVIRRGRRSLELAERSLAVEEARAAHEEEHVVPKKVRELERAVRKAEQDVAKSSAALERGELERRIRLMKAEHAVADKKEDLAKAQAKVGGE